MIVLVKDGLIDEVECGLSGCRIITQQWFDSKDRVRQYSTSYLSAILCLHDLEDTRVVIAEYQEGIVRALCYEYVQVAVVSCETFNPGVKNLFTEFGKYLEVKLKDKSEINNLLKLFSVNLIQHVLGVGSTYVFEYGSRFQIISVIEKRVNGRRYFCDVYDVGFVKFGYYDENNFWHHVQAEEINDILNLSIGIIPNIDFMVDGQLCGILEDKFKILNAVFGLKW